MARPVRSPGHAPHLGARWIQRFCLVVRGVEVKSFGEIGRFGAPALGGVRAGAAVGRWVGGPAVGHQD